MEPVVVEGGTSKNTAAERVNGTGKVVIVYWLP
jgi:hypothetical protein